MDERAIRRELERSNGADVDRSAVRASARSENQACCPPPMPGLPVLKTRTVRELIVEDAAGESSIAGPKHLSAASGLPAPLLSAALCR